MKILKIGRAGGFSLVELLVVIGINGIMSGIAIVSFRSMSGNMRLSSAAQRLNQTLLSARQQAITSRTVRRVAINLKDNSYCVEKRKLEYEDWDSNRINNIQIVGKENKFSENIIIADINGKTAKWLEDNDRNTNYKWYLEYNSKGAVNSYVQGPEESLDTVAIHLLEKPKSSEYAMIPKGNSHIAYNDLFTNSELLKYISEIDFLESGSDDPEDKVKMEARQMANTVYVLTLTGRSRVFYYGYDYPWSKEP